MVSFVREMLLVVLVALGAATGTAVVIATLMGESIVGLAFAAAVQALAVLVGMGCGATIAAPTIADRARSPVTTVETGQPRARAASRSVTNA